MTTAIQGALRALQAGDLGAAERACLGLLAADPSDATAMQVLGIALRRQGRLDEAEAQMRHAVALAPGNAEYRSNLGQLLAARGRVAEGLAELREAVRLAPGFRPAALALARLANMAGDHALAEEQARRLTGRDARDAEAWSALGSALFGLQRSDEAAEALRRALAIAPDYGTARVNLASVLATAEQSEEARAEVAECDRRGLRDRATELARARALMQLDRYDESEAVLLRLVAAAPDDADAQFLIAQMRHIRGDPDFARTLREAASRPGAPVATRMQYADILRRAGHPAESERLLRELIAREGEHPALTSSLATLLLETGRPAEAVAAGRLAAAALPDDVTTVENLVAALLAAGDPEAALPLIERFHREYPTDQRWITYRADAARQRGEGLFDDWCDLERLVRVYELEPPPGYASIHDFHAELQPALEARHRQATHPLDQSMRLGTQTSRGLLGDPDPLIRQYLSLLAAPLADYQAAIGQDPAHPMRSRNRGKARPTGCWSVRLGCGGFHVNHIHPQGWISSAYYVSVPAEVEDAEAQSGWLKFGEPRFATPGCAAGRIVQPRPGRLVLFPSYLWHGTNPIHGTEPRLTIAFDSLPL